MNVKEPPQNETRFHNFRRVQKTRMDAPFSERSSASFILTRARGLRILTFNKIKKTAIM